jgi:hypothetical protein
MKEARIINPRQRGTKNTKVTAETKRTRWRGFVIRAEQSQFKGTDCKSAPAWEKWARIANPRQRYLAPLQGGCGQPK